MRSNASPMDSFFDWQAAHVAFGIGPKVGGSPALEKEPIGSIDSVTAVREVSATIWVPLIVTLLEQHPDALSVEIRKQWRWDGGERRALGYGNAFVGGANGPVIPEHDWPLPAPNWDWDALSESRDEIRFRVTRTAVETFSLSGVCSAAPLAEIIHQQVWHKLDATAALDHVVSAYGIGRVARGKAPRRWGAPGLQLVKMYLAAGGNPNAMDAGGLTPLAVAIYLEQEAVVRQLVAAGADIQSPVGGLFAMDIAVLSGSVEMVGICHELGAPVVTSGYVQPVLRAVDMKSIEMLHALVDLGAEIEVETADGIALADYISAKAPGMEEHFRAILTAKSVKGAIDSFDGQPVKTAKSRTTLSL